MKEQKIGGPENGKEKYELQRDERHVEKFQQNEQRRQRSIGKV